jgi:hypothetical protein
MEISYMQNNPEDSGARLKKDIGKLRPSEQVRLVIERPERYKILKKKVEDAGGNIYDYETKMFLVPHKNISALLKIILDEEKNNNDDERREQLETLVLKALSKMPETLLMLMDEHPSYVPDIVRRVLKLYRTRNRELTAEEARRISEERDAIVYAAHARRELVFWERFFKSAAMSNSNVSGKSFDVEMKNAFRRAYEDFTKRDASGVTTFTGDRQNTRSYTKIQKTNPDGTVGEVVLKRPSPPRPKARFKL